MKTPEIRIYFSWLLYDNVSKDLFEKYAAKSDALASKEKCFEWARNYQQAWDKRGHDVLSKLSEALGLSFYRPIIDVACAPWLSPQSAPLLMGFYYEPDQFVDILLHELCHELLTENNVYAEYSSACWINLAERWEKLYGNHSLNTLVHIPVHALCKYIFIEVLAEPNRVTRDYEDCKGKEDYLASWEYVNTHDYKEIIAQLKAGYQAISQL